MTFSDPDSTTNINRSGGADLSAGHDLTVGGDVTGRDKIVSAGGHIINAGQGATVIIGDAHVAPVVGEPPHIDQADVDKALQKYREYMRDRYSTTRLIGKPQPVPINDIFTNIYLLDRPTAFQRYDLESLKTEHTKRGVLSRVAKRLNALDVVREQDRLFILGKPGAGKTTLLKYLTFQAASGKLDRVPIFISLNEWASSGLALLSFIQRQFDICDFPDVTAFIQRVLKHGQALICFDGLDEVNAANNQRTAMTRVITDFTNQYPRNKYLITCRIAATDYTFEQFTYVEIADFTPEQVQVFVGNWFGQDEGKTQRFADVLDRPEHRGLRELTQTPLLLTLLCLAFETKSTFPLKRAELYEEALDALLKTWDKSRNVEREEIYRGLSLGRKRQLLTRVAAEYFEHGDIFFGQPDLAKRVSAFLKTLSGTGDADEPEGGAVVRAVEAQHGLFVERAHRVYSFSHLTLQEYFTARYIVDHVVDGALERLIKAHLTDDRWREVFLLTASMLPIEAAEAFFAVFQHTLDDLIAGDEQLLAYGRWAVDKARDYAHLEHSAIARTAARAIDAITNVRARSDRTFSFNLASALVLDLAICRARDRTFAAALDRTRDRTLSLDLALACDRALRRAADLDRALDLASIFIGLFVQLRRRESGQRFIAALAQVSLNAGQSELAQALNTCHLPDEKSSESEWQVYSANLQALLIRYRNIGHAWNFTDEQRQRLDQYEQGTVLLAECLQMASVSDRQAIENRLLLPPED